VIARDWLIIEARPWRSREELEARVAELEAENALLRDACFRWCDEVLGLQIELTRRTRQPGNPTSERQLRRRRAQARERAQKHGIWVTTADDMLRWLARPRCNDLP
jgi:hypothetical protein